MRCFERNVLFMFVSFSHETECLLSLTEPWVGCHHLRLRRLCVRALKGKRFRLLTPDLVEMLASPRQLLAVRRKWNQRSKAYDYEKSHGRILLAKCVATAAAGVGLHVATTARVSICFQGTHTGGLQNPIVSFGTAVINNNWTNHWVSSSCSTSIVKISFASDVLKKYCQSNALMQLDFNKRKTRRLSLGVKRKARNTVHQR